MIQTVSKTTTGNSTGTIGSNIRGKILAIKLTADSNVTNNWDIALVGSSTGIPIMTDAAVANNATEWSFPRALANKVADASAATDWFTEIPLVDEGVSFTITNAGTTGSITITVIYETSPRG